MKGFSEIEPLSKYNKRSHRYLSSFFLGAALSFLGGYSHAVVTPEGDNIQLFSATDSAVDILTISPPNASGISVNHFSEFSVVDQPLHILNASGSRHINDVDVDTEAAELIVIVADSINLENKIKLLGVNSDLVLLATDASGSIRCVDCDFENMMRLSLVTSTVDVANDISQLGELDPSAASSVSITNLQAPGAIGLDVLTGNITVAGAINTHQKAIADSNGGYTIQTEGDLSVGSGVVNILAGDITWNYNDNIIKQVGNSFSGAHVLTGSITSTGVKLSTTDSIVVDMNIDTQSDLLSSASYQGGAYIPQEVVDIQTFSNNNLTLAQTQINSSLVKLKATGGLHLQDQSEVNAADVEFIAGTTLNNHANVNGSKVSLAGDSVTNQGQLIADTDLNVWAYKHLANQYGGEMKANAISLESATQVVRNGSRTPYISQTSEISPLISDFTSSTHAINMGTFYRLQGGVNVSDSSWLKADSNLAKIVANRIEIKGIAFENINPYYEKVRSDGMVEMEVEHIAQVSVFAEHYLGIEASSYIINSSAGVTVNDVDGQFEASTALFVNERYRIATTLGKEEESSQQFLSNGYISKLFNVNEESFGSKVLAYSVPGSIRVLGDFDLKASQSFVNDIAYLEVFGDAALDTPIVNDIGLKNESVAQLTAYDPNQYHGGGFRAVIKQYFHRLNPTPYAQQSTVVSAGDLDSLFFVQGDVLASSAIGWFRNYNPLDYFVGHAMYGGSTSQTSVNYSSGQQASIEAAKQSGDVVVSGTTHDLFDRLDQVLTSFVNSVTQFFAELDWWN